MCQNSVTSIQGSAYQWWQKPRRYIALSKNKMIRSKVQCQLDYLLAFKNLYIFYVLEDVYFFIAYMCAAHYWTSICLLSGESTQSSVIACYSEKTEKCNAMCKWKNIYALCQELFCKCQINPLMQQRLIFYHCLAYKTNINFYRT